MSSDSDAFAQHARVQAQFGKSASSYLTSAIHAKGDELQVMLELTAPVSGLDVLDIATGAGHTAITFAEAGANVTATDITPEMLDVTRQHAEGKGLDVTVETAAAEQLPFADASFDVVTCRIAAHHFADVSAFMREATRVLRPAGKLLIVDNIAPEDEALAQVMNEIEKRRDPSHVRALSLLEWLQVAKNAGLDGMYVSRWKRSKNVATWCDRMHMVEADKKKLERTVLQFDSPTKRYFGVSDEARKVITLHHEAVLMMFARATWGKL